MAASLIYKNSFLYEIAMLALYGRHYSVRYRLVAGLIPPRSSVLDLCCGPGILYDRYLRRKAVQYTGLDLSEHFINRLNDRGAQGHVWDVRASDALPSADYVVMQASLHQFLPEPRPIVERMLQAARKQVIIAEPVRNLASSNIPLAATIARYLTNPGSGPSAARFTQQTLDLFFKPYLARVSSMFLIPGGREKVYVLDSTPKDFAYNDASKSFIA
jgi:SAM-dependent methyltransferase